MGRKIKLSESIGLQLKEFRTKYKVKVKILLSCWGKARHIFQNLRKVKFSKLKRRIS